MEQKLELKAQVRENTGSSYAKTVRKQGQIPVVIYGHKLDAIAVSLNAHDFTEGLHHGHRLFDVKIGRKKETVLVKDIQYDHLGKNIIHADLIRVDVSERVTVEVPIVLKGTAKGTHEGGIIEEQTDRLEIECLVTNIPENILVSVKEIGLGDRITAKDIELPEGIKLVTEPDTIIVTCHVVAAAKTTEEIEEEEPAAPEVIGRGKEAEEEEAAEKKEEKE